jgi:outer membrane immunogenic protein
MKKKCFGLLAGVTLVGFASSAMAADLPARQVYRQAEVAAPVANWTGWYVGLGGGYGMFDATTNTSATALGGVVTTGASSTTGGKGAFGRIQTGYDYQFAGNWVLGAFADWDFSSIKGTVAEPLVPGVFPLKQTSAWGVGGRIGYLITPSILTFFDGGYASARFRSGAETPATPAGVAGITIPHQTYSGYFLGGGTEVMIAPGWFVKSEYRLASYGAKTTPDVLGPPTTPGTTAATFTAKPVVQTISAELVYKFNWGR